MIGSIEELEKEIEQFHKNVAASGELVALLDKISTQIKQQNEDFGKESDKLIKRFDELPDKFETANKASNKEIKEYIESKLDESVQGFKKEQSQYVDELKTTRDKINEAEKDAEKKYSDFIANVEDRSDNLLKRVDALPEIIEKSNKSSNDEIKNEVKAELDNNLQLFSKEQRQYIESFNTAQQQYASELKQTQEGIKSAEDNINQKYKAFIDDLEKMNVSNLYDQNIELRKSLNKTTILLAILSIASILVSIAGFFIK